MHTAGISCLVAAVYLWMPAAASAAAVAAAVSCKPVETPADLFGFVIGLQGPVLLHQRVSTHSLGHGPAAQ